MNVPDPHKKILHGTAVEMTVAGLPPAAVFLRGTSGSGKSDLAFRLIEMTGARLIADDQVALETRHARIYADAVPATRGLLEVRGIGLLRLPVAPATPVALVVDLVRRDDVPRMPEDKKMDILGIPVPFLRLHAFDAATPYKIRAAMTVVRKPEMVVR